MNPSQPTIANRIFDNRWLQVWTDTEIHNQPQPFVGKIEHHDNNVVVLRNTNGDCYVINRSRVTLIITSTEQPEGEMSL